jgi:Uma2 family endonuclease
MSAPTIPDLTPEEYLEIEEAADYKSEYFRGRMWPLGGKSFGMAGGKVEHNLVAANLTGELRSALKGKCLVLNSDQRIRASATGLYTYADVSVVSGKPVVAEKQTLTNPRIVVEVLSKTTESNDRGAKFAPYVKLESLEEYVLVSQTEPRVKTYRRQPDGAWLWREYTGLNASVDFKSVDCAIPMTEVYAGVEFDENA